MIRMQVQFTEEQAAGLKELASRTGRSISDIVRESVDTRLKSRNHVSREERIRQALEITGMFASDDPGANVSENHDQYLAEIYGDFLKRR